MTDNETKLACLESTIRKLYKASEQLATCRQYGNIGAMADTLDDLIETFERACDRFDK